MLFKLKVSAQFMEACSKLGIRGKGILSCLVSFFVSCILSDNLPPMCLSHTSEVCQHDVIENCARERCVVQVIYELRAGTRACYITYERRYIESKIREYKRGNVTELYE